MWALSCITQFCDFNPFRPSTDRCVELAGFDECTTDSLRCSSYVVCATKIEDFEALISLHFFSYNGGADIVFERGEVPVWRDGAILDLNFCWSEYHT